MNDEQTPSTVYLARGKKREGRGVDLTKRQGRIFEEHQEIKIGGGPAPNIITGGRRGSEAIRLTNQRLGQVAQGNFSAFRHAKEEKKKQERNCVWDAGGKAGERNHISSLKEGGRLVDIGARYPRKLTGGN